MNKFIETIVLAFGGVGVLFVLLLFAPFVGGIAGWVFAWIFEDSFKALMRLLHWNATGFEVGAALAFIGAFLKAGARISSD